MKKTLLIGIAAVLAVSLAVLGAGCVGGDPIVGDWKISATGTDVKFNADGTGHFTVKILGVTSEFSLTWKKVDGVDKTYDISTTEIGIPVGQYKISDDGKTLTGPITLVRA